jgi:DNA-binding CsgD family transcriptional regulator
MYFQIFGTPRSNEQRARLLATPQGVKIGLKRGKIPRFWSVTALGDVAPSVNTRFSGKGVGMIEPHLLMRIEELARFLTSGSHTAAALGKHLVEKTLTNLDLISLYFFRSDNDGKMRFAGGHNLPSQTTDKWPSFDIDTELPLTECVRNQETIWLTGKDEWESNYPLMKEYPVNPSLKTFINTPMRVEGHPIAALGLSSRAELKRSPELASFIAAVSGLTGLYAQNLPEFRGARQEGISRRILSRRQNNILNLMREKLTNREIGDELGYSESTIRQETMRIYEILSVDNRREAAAFKFLED